MLQSVDTTQRTVKTVRGRIEGDGLVSEVFNLLWCLSSAGEAAGLALPETIVIEQGFPKVWYTYSKEAMEVERRLGKDIVLSKVHSQWASGAAAHEVVAEFASQRTESTTRETVVRLEYFDPPSLLRFLQTRSQGVSGLLQRFVPPKAACNVVLQATWSPHATLCCSRRNVHLLSHSWVPPSDRCCTFDGPPSLSTIAPVSPYVRQKVQKELQKFAQRVGEHQKAGITGMVCYLKLDVHGTLHMLKCTSVRTVRNPADPSPVVPLCLGVRFEAVTAKKASDTLVVRDVGAEIDLANITDSALDLLRIDTRDMLYYPPPALPRRGAPPRYRRPQHPPSPPHATHVPLPPPASPDPTTTRRVSLGFPAVAKLYPEEYTELVGFLNDVAYNCRWHFLREGVRLAPHNFRQLSSSDKKAPKPFELTVPEQVLSIIGYEGVEAFMHRFDAVEIPELTDAPQGDERERRAPDGEVSQEMYLRISSPRTLLLNMGSLQTFAVERLATGLPKYEGGIDWTRIRERSANRRSTQWLRMVGASTDAFKSHDEFKKRIGLKTVADLLMLGSPKKGVPLAHSPRAALSPPTLQSIPSLSRVVPLRDDDYLRGRLATADDFVVNTEPVVSPTGSTHREAPGHRFLRRGCGKGGGQGGGCWSPGAWRLVSAFPPQGEPPPRARPRTGAPPPKHRYFQDGSFRNTGFRTQQEQLDYWCQ